MNLFALSTGLVLKPTRMWRAFERGCRSFTLYPESRRAQVDSGRWTSTGHIRGQVLETRRSLAPEVLRTVEFGIYTLLAAGLHACLAIPAVIAQFVADTALS